MAFDGGILPELLDAIGNNNAKGEFYLTDAVALARERGLSCTVVEAPEDEVMGINSRAELAVAEAGMQQRLRAAAMAANVSTRGSRSLVGDKSCDSVDRSMPTACANAPRLRPLSAIT